MLIIGNNCRTDVHAFLSCYSSKTRFDKSHFALKSLLMCNRMRMIAAHHNTMSISQVDFIMKIQAIPKICSLNYYLANSKSMYLGCGFSAFPGNLYTIETE